MCVSTLVGSISWYIFGYDFVRSIIITTLLQFVFFAIYNNIKLFIAERATERELTLRITEFNKQSVDAPCAYCGVTNSAPIRMDSDNNFTCDNCGKTSAIYISMTTAQKTQMIDTTRLNVSSYIAEKIKDDIKEQ